MMKFARVWVLGALAVMLAAPAHAQRPGGFGGGRGGGGSSELLRMPEVQKELKLDSAQTDLLQQLGMEMGQKRRQMFEGVDFRNMSDAQRQEMGRKMQTIETENDK